MTAKKTIQYFDLSYQLDIFQSNVTEFSYYSLYKDFAEEFLAKNKNKSDLIAAYLNEIRQEQYQESIGLGISDKDIQGQIENINYLINAIDNLIDSGSDEHTSDFIHNLLYLQIAIQEFNKLLEDYYKNNNTSSLFHSLVRDAVVFEEIYIKGIELNEKTFVEAMEKFVSKNKNLTNNFTGYLKQNKNSKDKSGKRKIIRIGYTFKSLKEEKAYYEVRSYVSDVNKDYQNYLLRHLRCIKQYAKVVDGKTLTEIEFDKIKKSKLNLAKIFYEEQIAEKNQNRFSILRKSKEK